MNDSIRSDKGSEKVYKMDFIQRITLSPFQKYTQFGLFPWKFIFHLLLVVLCTYQALKIVSIQDKHTRIQQQVFSSVYLQNDDGTSSYPYYSLSQFTDTFFDIFNQTDQLNDTLLQYSDVREAYYRMEIYYSEMDEGSWKKNRPIILEGDGDTFFDELQKIPLHDENYTQMKLFIQEVETMKMRISNLITYIEMDQNQKMSSCLNWTVNIRYSFQSFANVIGDLEALSESCLSGENLQKKQSLIAINVAVMIISIFSLLTLWKQVYDVSKEYMIYKKNLSSGKTFYEQSKLKTSVDWKKNWEELGFFDKMKFFDFWFVIGVTANFFQLFGGLVALLDELIITNLMIFGHKQFLIGFGVMLAWITMLKYLQYNNNLNLMTATLSKSWGVMPFFLGFVFLGQTIFWKYSKFQNTSSSAVTLFSLLNGDIVNDTFLETWAEGIIGQIYLIIFMILFYTAVQNVFVTIIMQGYEQSIKQRQYKKMVEQKEQKEKAARFLNILNIQQEQRNNFIISFSPQMLPQQQTSYQKLKINGRKIDKILEEIVKLKEEIKQSDLSTAEKVYINRMLKETLQSIQHSLRLQLNQMSTVSFD